jgi:hypothetical protein
MNIFKRLFGDNTYKVAERENLINENYRLQALLTEKENYIKDLEYALLNLKIKTEIIYEKEGKHWFEAMNLDLGKHWTS